MSQLEETDEERAAPAPVQSASPSSPTGRASRLRRAVAALGWLLAGAVVAALGTYLFGISRQQSLEPWHRVELDGEITADDGIATLDEYLAAEARLFDELDRRLQDGFSSAPLNRFNPSSPTYPGRLAVDGNRTFELGVGGSAGGVLLLHGLSDAPYSLRPLGERLARAGMYVLGLRLPGHGTLPSGLRRVHQDDWRAAVRVAAPAVAERGGNGPLVLVGYSNGAALALEYTIAALDDPALPVPDRLVLISPALDITPLAAVSRWQEWLGRLPGLEKMAWQAVLPEYDPFKYNSFAFNAAQQILDLTRLLERRLAELESAGRLGELPPVLAFQSVVDATVPPLPSLARLYPRLSGERHELVLFDVNRVALSMRLLVPEVDRLLDAVEDGDRFAVRTTLVTNREPHSSDVVARTREPGATATDEEDLGVAWPIGIYSLSHVALPFPPDDPFYGAGSGGTPPFPLGSLELRGERGAMRIPVDLLMRLRYDPFFSYLADRTLAFLARDSDPEESEQSAPGDSDL